MVVWNQLQPPAASIRRSSWEPRTACPVTPGLWSTMATRVSAQPQGLGASCRAPSLGSPETKGACVQASLCPASRAESHISCLSLDRVCASFYCGQTHTEFYCHHFQGCSSVALGRPTVVQLSLLPGARMFSPCVCTHACIVEIQRKGDKASEQSWDGKAAGLGLFFQI